MWCKCSFNRYITFFNWNTVRRGPCASPTLCPQGPKHIVNCRGQCTHKGGYCQFSPLRLCAHPHHHQPQPEGRPTPWGSRRISVTVAPQGGHLGLVSKRHLCLQLEGPGPERWLTQRWLSPAGGHVGGSGTRKQNPSSSSCLPHKLSASGLQAQHRGSLHFLGHAPSPLPKCGFRAWALNSEAWIQILTSSFLTLHRWVNRLTSLCLSFLNYKYLSHRLLWIKLNSMLMTND